MAVTQHKAHYKLMYNHGCYCQGATDKRFNCAESENEARSAPIPNSDKVGSPNALTGGCFNMYCQVNLCDLGCIGSATATADMQALVQK